MENQNSGGALTTDSWLIIDDYNLKNNFGDSVLDILTKQ